MKDPIMRQTLCGILLLALASPGAAQSALPLRWSELSNQAAKWPPAWAGLVRAVVPPRDAVVLTDGKTAQVTPRSLPIRLKDVTFVLDAGTLKITGDQIVSVNYFEDDVLARLRTVMAAEPTISAETFRLADIVLSATLRHHLSVRQTEPSVDEHWHRLSMELRVRQIRVRQDWLDLLHTKGDLKAALTLADQWLPATTKDDPLGESIQQLWSKQAKDALDKFDYAAARIWVDRLEGAFVTAPEAVRKPLLDRAQGLLKEAQALPDAEAIRALEEALQLWPRLPDARDALERRKGTFQTLVVAVRSLPMHLSPATAWSESEKQALELLFDRLYRVEQRQGLGKRYRPLVATALPTGALTATILLRSDAYWSSGERLTAADLRHTAYLMNQTDAAGRSALWRDFLERPPLAGKSFELKVKYRQGLFDPLAPLTFWILPRDYHGKELQRADDAEFAKAPIGSGPFQYVGRKSDAGKTFAVFQANPHDLRQAPSSLREIRMMTWSDARKDLSKPLPHLILDAPTDQLPVLKEMGYIERDAKAATCVHFLAVNHRKASLAPVSVRRAIAHAIDRQGLLDRIFRTDALKGKYHSTANGLFPRASWANAPAPTVPAELFNVEQARSFARKLDKDSAAAAWTLKYAAGDERVKMACEAMAQAIAVLFQGAKLNVNVQAQGLSTAALRKALDERDYDLLYTSADSLDDPVRLALLFDRQDDATRAGGTNYLGYENDVKLSELLRAALEHRQFAAVQENMQGIHVQLYETMPVIPLWQLDVHVLTHPSLATGALDTRFVFAKVREWTIAQ